LPALLTTLATLLSALSGLLRLLAGIFLLPALLTALLAALWAAHSQNRLEANTKELCNNVAIDPNLTTET
jgi:hypothetical protein